jgi:small acid-soluble spore protein H (minor)
MDVNRAKQIVSSPKEIGVLYHGVPIWIKNYNESNASASIFNLDNPDDLFIVDVKELEEK